MGIYDPTRPAPSVLSATIVGHVRGSLEIIEVQWQDSVADEALTSVYTTGKRAAATQNIGGTTDTGKRLSTVLLPNGTETLQMRYLWSDDLSDPTKSIWGPFSNQVAVTK